LTFFKVLKKSKEEARVVQGFRGSENEYDNTFEIPDHDDIRMELEAENTNEESKNYIRDLLQQEYSQEMIDVLIAVPIAVNKLSPWQRILWQKHFVGGMSGRAISRELSQKIKVPVGAVCSQIKDIREFIKSEIKQIKDGMD